LVFHGEGNDKPPEPSGARMMRVQLMVVWVREGFPRFRVHSKSNNAHFSVVAQPSRLRVRTASRRSKRHGARTPVCV